MPEEGCVVGALARGSTCRVLPQATEIRSPARRSTTRTPPKGNMPKRPNLMTAKRILHNYPKDSSISCGQNSRIIEAP